MPALRTELVQNAWVVDDLDKAMRGWLGQGVGPFHTLDIRHENAIYRGRPVPLSFRVGLAQAGPIQIELIQQTSDGDSAYRDVVPKGEVGFHHVCMMTDDCEQEVARLLERGFAIANEINSRGNRTCYMDTRSDIGCMLEILPPSPLLLKIYQIVARSAQDWDGSDPVRAMNLEALLR